MKNIKVRFELDPALDQIEVLVHAPELDEEVEKLIERISAHPPELLTVTDMDGAIRKISEDERISVSVDGKQVQIVTGNGSYKVRQTLQSLEDGLDPQKFVRISRYELVNLTKVRKYDFTLTGTLRLELAGGIETWASRRCIPTIRRKLQGKE